MVKKIQVDEKLVNWDFDAKACIFFKMEKSSTFLIWAQKLQLADKYGFEKIQVWDIFKPGDIGFLDLKYTQGSKKNSP